jgi:hypothetical protein
MISRCVSRCLCGVIIAAFAITGSALLSGCLAVRSPAIGLIYTDVQGPVTVTSAKSGAKSGTGCASSILGLFAQGDASVATAASSAGISEISSVDEAAYSVVGIYGTYCVTVHGN